MAFVRTAYLAMHETAHEIEGQLRLYTMENMDGTTEQAVFELSFYRPASGVKPEEWVKDMLVQCIEQL